MTAREYALKMKEISAIEPPSFEMKSFGENTWCTLGVTKDGDMTMEMSGDETEEPPTFTPEQAIELAKWLGEVFASE